jgi:hypothetical protein
VRASLSLVGVTVSPEVNVNAYCAIIMLRCGFGFASLQPVSLRSAQSLLFGNSSGLLVF